MTQIIDTNHRTPYPFGTMAIVTGTIRMMANKVTAYPLHRLKNKPGESFKTDIVSLLPIFK
jgi:hypothetical protein